MPKTWYQHDMNCRKKEGLSLLRKAGGNAAYGAFHVLQELWLEMQQHRSEYTSTFTINESTLMRELGINARSFPKFRDILSESCGIVWRLIPKVFGNNSNVSGNNRKVTYNNWQITLPKSLIFIDPRRGKLQATDTKTDTKTINKSRKPAAPRAPKFTYLQYLESLGSEFAEILADKVWLKKATKDFPDADILRTIERSREYWQTEKGYKKKKGAAPDWRATLRNAFYTDWAIVPKKSSNQKPSAGPWGASKLPCGMRMERDGKRMGCSLKKGHEGPHQWEELYDGAGVKDAIKGTRVDKGLQKIGNIVDVPHET